MTQILVEKKSTNESSALSIKQEVVSPKLQLPKPTEVLIELGMEFTSQFKAINDLHLSIKGLENSIPGTIVKTTTDIDAIKKCFKSITDNISKEKIPPGLKDHVDNIKKSTDSFAEFVKAYDTFTKAPESHWYNPFTWWVKSNAAADAFSKWSAFRETFDRTSVKILKDPLFNKPPEDIKIY